MRLGAAGQKLDLLEIFDARTIILLLRAGGMLSARIILSTCARRETTVRAAAKGFLECRYTTNTHLRGVQDNHFFAGAPN